MTILEFNIVKLSISARKLYFELKMDIDFEKKKNQFFF